MFSGIIINSLFAGFSGRAGKGNQILVNLGLLAFGCCCVSPGLISVAFTGIGQRNEAAKQPIDVTLAELSEMVDYPTDPVRIGRHFACYDELVIMYWTKEDSTEKIDNETNVQSIEYPIVDASDEYAVAMNAALKKYGTLNEVPFLERPNMRKYFVIVRSKRHDQMGDVSNSSFEEVESIVGVLKRTPSSDHFPRGTIFLEEITKPPSWWEIIAQMVIGLICGAFSIALLVSTVISIYQVATQPKKAKRAVPCPHCGAGWRANALGNCSQCGKPWHVVEPGEFPEIRE